MSPIFFFFSLATFFFYPYPAPQPDPDLHQHEKWDPDPHQKVLDPPQCYKQNIVTDLELYKNLNNLTANQTIVKVMSRVKSVSTRPQLNNIFHDTVPLRSLYLFCKKLYVLRNRLLPLLSLQKFVVDIVIFRDVDHSLIATVILTTMCIMNRWSSRFTKECFIIMNIEPSKCFSLQGIKIWHFLILFLVKHGKKTKKNSYLYK